MQMLVNGKKVNVSPVKSVTTVGPRHVYNMEVDQEHQYFANSILTKNSNYHSMLDHYGHKYNDELYKIKDTFVSYKHRRLLCLTGDSLIDTDQGMFRIKDQLAGLKAKGLRDQYHLIEYWWHTGQDECARVSTVQGYSITGTLDHKVVAYKKGWEKPKKVKVKNLTSDHYLGLNRSPSTYPERLPLSYIPSLPVYNQIVQYIAKCDSFTSKDLLYQFPHYTTMYALLSNLKRHGQIEAVYNKDRTKYDPKFTYQKSSDFSISQAIQSSNLTTGKHTRYSVTIPTEMTDELASVLGYLVSEGWYNKHWGFCNHNPKVMELFLTRFYQVFNVKLSSLDPSKTQVVILYKEIQDFFRYLGLKKSVAGSKSIPWSILQAPESCVKAFLRSLFEGDGTVTKGFIRYYSKSKTLIEELQIILLRFGIISTQIKSRDLWFLALSTQGAYLYYNKIGFDTKKGLVKPPISLSNTVEGKVQVPGYETVAWLRVKYVQSVGVRQTYNIGVDHEQHLIVTNGVINGQCYPSGPNKKTLRGRCVVYSTLTSTNRGFLRFDEIIKNSGYTQIDGLIVDSPRGPLPVSHTYKGKSKTIKVVTRNGFTLEGTPEHPVLTINKELKFKWKTLDTIQTGDWILSKTKNNKPLYGSNTQVTMELATILGYMVANGYDSSISSSDPKVIERLYAAVFTLTGNYPASRNVNNGRDTDKIYKSHLLNANGNKGFVRSYLHPLGYTAKNSKDKTIPLAVRMAPKEIVHEFLEAYFECDSGVNGGSSTNNAPCEVEVGSVSKELATQLHVMLYHYYGIIGRLVKKVWCNGLNRKTGVRDQKRIQWLITITGGDAMRFLNSFKRAKVQKYRDRFRAVPDGYGLESEDGSDRRRVPYIREYLWNLYEDSRLKDPNGKVLRRLQLKDGSVILNKLKPKCFARITNKKNRVISPTTPEFLVYEDDWPNLLPLLTKIDPEKARRVKRFIRLQAHYEEVVKVENSDKLKAVYDLTVPRHHMFTANGLTSHNTRFLCLAGSTLVSTNQGLKPIKEDLTGLTTHVNGRATKILDWKMSGIKRISKVELVTGHYLLSSDDHRVRVYQDGVLAWKKVRHLTSQDRVVLSLGGSFPSQLRFDFTCSDEKPAYLQLTERMDSLTSFDKSDILDPPIPGFSTKSIWAITSKLVKSGYLNKVYRKGKMVAGFDRCYYEKSPSFSFQTVSSFLKGPLQEKKDKIIFPSHLTNELAALLGFYNADGSYNQDAPEFSYCTSDDGRAKEFKSSFAKCFGISPRYASFQTTAGVKMHQYTVAVKPIKEFLRYVGLTPVTSEFKEVPWVIRQGTRSAAINYLRALTTSDGSIEPHVPAVDYKTISYKLAVQVQLLIASLGIFSRIMKVKRETGSSTKYIYFVHMTQADASQFLALIGIPCKHKSGRRYKEVTIDGPIFAAKIRKIKKLGEKKTYDIAVDSSLQGFTANGITVHNSGIDEIGWFDSNADKNLVKMDANEVYIALDRSLLTVRAAANKLIKQGYDTVPTGYAFNISSPSSARDKIMELVTQAQHSKKLLGFKRATWEMNPEITKDDLSEEFRKDPQAAERDYGCNPPLSDNAFISSFSSIEGCFVGKKNKLSYSYAAKKSKDGTLTRYVKILDVAASSKPNILAIDAGYSNNSFSMVTGHLHQGIPIITCLCEVQPVPGSPLNHSLIFKEMVMPLIHQRNVKILISDRWQNIKLLQDAEQEAEDLSTMALSLKYPNFWHLKQTMFDSEIVFPRLSRSYKDILNYDQSKYPYCFHDPLEHLVLQLLTVRDQGNAVIKGDNVTDDIFRCVCLAHAILSDPAYSDIFNEYGEEEEHVKQAAIGVVQSFGSATRSSQDGKAKDGKAIGVILCRKR